MRKKITKSHHPKNPVNRGKAKQFPRLAKVSIVGLVVIAAAVWLLIPRAQQLQINEVSTQNAVSLTLSPTNSNVAANTTTTVSVSLSAAVAKTSAVQGEIAYSSTCLTPTFTPGTFLPNVLVAPSVHNGLITFALSAPVSSGGVAGSGIIGTITTGPTSTSCELSVTDNTQIAVIGFDANALSSKSGTIIALPGVSPIASPSTDPSTPTSSLPSTEPSLAPSTQPTTEPSPSTTTTQTTNTSSPAPAKTTIPKSNTTTTNTTSKTANPFSPEEKPNGYKRSSQADTDPDKANQDRVEDEKPKKESILTRIKNFILNRLRSI